MLRKALQRSQLVTLLTLLLAMPSIRAEAPTFDIEKIAPPAEADRSFKFGPDENKGSSVFSSSNSSFDKTFATKNADSVFNHSADMNGKEITLPSASMNKSYAARSYSLPGYFTGFDNSTNSLPMKSSAFASQNASGFNRTFDMPTYTGPEAERIRKDMQEIDKTLANTKDLPDRSLSVQEVRDLLNHNAKPQKGVPAPTSDTTDAKK